MNNETVTKIDGGFWPVSWTALLVCWQAYFHAATLIYLDVRVWIACHELLARRCEKGEKVVPRYALAELRELLGDVSDSSLRASLRRLKNARILLWSASRRAFTEFADLDFPKEPKEDDRYVPVPRRLLRFLARCEQWTLVPAALGVSERCLFYRKQQKSVSLSGRCSASRIVETFGVSKRSVRSALKELVALGWLKRERSDHWSQQRHGARFTVNPAWPGVNGMAQVKPAAPKSQRAQTELQPVLHPEGPVLRPILHPHINKKLPSVSRYQNLAGEPAGVCKRELALTPERKLPAPTLRNVRLEDLESFSRTCALYRQDVRSGRLVHSESQVLNYLGAAVRAKSVAGNPVKIFRAIVNRGLWHHITQEQEERARRALVRYREVNPEVFRL